MWHASRQHQTKSLPCLIMPSHLLLYLQVTASDPDCGADAGVTYTIANNLGFQLPMELEVRRDTGQICVTQPLDYETRQTYDFPVLATDPGNAAFDNTLTNLVLKQNMGLSVW